MRLTVSFEQLKQAADKIGAPDRTIDLSDAGLEALQILQIELEQGVQVQLEDVEVNLGGLLGYKGHQVVLYIPDQGWGYEDVLEDPGKGKKVHVSDCKTLIRMRNQGRFERYVVRNGLSPDFLITGSLRSGETVEGGTAKLRVCQNCLKRLNYRNAANLTGVGVRRIVAEFSLEQFFSTYSSYFTHMPRRREADVRANSYSPNWNEISAKRRQSAGWCCTACGVDLSSKENRRLLHVHHKNGNRSDNRESNLEVLCVDCHSKQPAHQSLFVLRADRICIHGLRRSQGRYKPLGKPTKAKEHWDTAFEYADPAVHGLLFQAKHCGWTAPEIGGDIVDQSGRVICSNVEAIWTDQRIAAYIDAGEGTEKAKSAGWKMYSAQALLDQLQAGPA